MNLKDSENCSKFKLWSQKERLVRWLVLFLCCVIVIIQLGECISKLRNPPITTHSHYELNESMTLPAVTFCREPPYKPEILAKYYLNSPQNQLEWKDFPFDSVELEEFFKEATFNEIETFHLFGLAGKKDDVKIESSLHFNFGLCHTLRPLKMSKNAARQYGYSILLKHHMRKDNNTSDDISPGYHIYVHDAKEDFTEISMRSSGKVEYIFADVEEEIEIKLQTQLFAMMPDQYTTCTNGKNYSAPKCGELCIWNEITKRTNCTAPWMQQIDLPNCRNFKDMEVLIKQYNKVFFEDEEQNCECPEPCNSIIYSTYVMNRRDLINKDESLTQIYIYYTSKLVTLIEERPGYDLSQFTADIGGSIGFLLGLSVLGFIEILEKVLAFVFCRTKLSPEKPSGMENKSAMSSSYDAASVSTTDISDVDRKIPTVRNNDIEKN